LNKQKSKQQKTHWKHTHVTVTHTDRLLINFIIVLFHQKLKRQQTTKIILIELN